MNGHILRITIVHDLFGHLGDNRIYFRFGQLLINNGHSTLWRSGYRAALLACIEAVPSGAQVRILQVSAFLFTGFCSGCGAVLVKNYLKLMVSSKLSLDRCFALPCVLNSLFQ